MRLPNYRCHPYGRFVADYAVPVFQVDGISPSAKRVTLAGVAIAFALLLI